MVPVALVLSIGHSGGGDLHMQERRGTLDSFLRRNSLRDAYAAL